MIRWVLSRHLFIFMLGKYIHKRKVKLVRYGISVSFLEDDVDLATKLLLDLANDTVD